MPSLMWAQAFLLLAGVLCAEDLSVQPAAIHLLQVEGGPLAATKLTIRTHGPSVAWTASASSSDPQDPWVQLSATAGTTPGWLVVGIVPSRGEHIPPGTYRATITVKMATASAVIPVDLEIRRAHPPPLFSYPAGPRGCNGADGYPDPPLCPPPPVLELSNALAIGATYTDPTFGSQVRVLSNASVYHTYSTPTPLSAHNKYLMTYLADGTFDIVETATGKTTYKKVAAAQSFFWDASDDDVYYYIRDSAIVRHNVHNNHTAVLVDYAKPPWQFREILRGGTGDTSKDNWVSFWAPDEQQVCALDLNQVKTYCTDYSATQGRLPYHDIDFTLISKGVDRQSGKRYVILVAEPSMGVFSVDPAAGKLKLEFRGPEEPEGNGNYDGICNPGEACLIGSHLDTMEDSEGIQYFVMDAETRSPCEYALSTYQLNKGKDILTQVELGGGRKKVLTLWRCGPGWVDEHVGCAKAAPYCVVSTQNVRRGSADHSPQAATPHAGEILVMRGNGLEIRRLALTRSAIFSDGSGNEQYWSSPRAALSNDGSLVVSDSNFGELGKQRVTLIQTGFGGQPK
jgi:hypothetical protein